MHIRLHLSNRLVAEALRQLIVEQGYPQVSVHGNSRAKGTTPDVLLVDIATLSSALLAQYPEAKVLLVDNGIEHQRLCRALLSYRLHGILPVHTEPPLLVKALKVVSEGQVWLDNGSVRSLLHGDATAFPEGPVSAREQDIIDGVCQGLDNKEIAERLTISPHTVKAHLNRIFRKLSVTNRSQLITRMLQTASHGQ